MERRILLNPGPATTTDSVKQAQIVPDICPREKEFQNLMKSIRRDLVKIAGGNKNYSAILFAGSGTAVMESTMVSVIPEGKWALIISNGAYGKRFKEIAVANAIPNIEIEIPYGRKINIERIKYVLESDVNFGVVFVTHHETTTGILNPIKEIGELAKKYNCLYVIDTISSFAGIPFSIQKVKADFIMSTSNKCLQGMSGISFVIGKREEIEKCKYNLKSYYLDLYSQYKYLEEKGQMRFTAPVQTMYALRQAIDELFEEGLENRYERYKKNNKILVEGMKERGFRLFLTQDVDHSFILETFYELKGMDFNKFHDKLYEEGFTIYPGKLDNKNTFRLANMGNLKGEDIENFLKAVDKVLDLKKKRFCRLCGALCYGTVCMKCNKKEKTRKLSVQYHSRRWKQKQKEKKNET